MTVSEFGAEERERGGVPPALRLVLAVQAGAALLCLACEAFCRLVLHLKAPYDWPILTDVFPDFVLLLPTLQRVHTPAFFHSPVHVLYPAPAAFAYAPFVWLGPHRTAIFVGTLLGVFCVAAGLFARALLVRGLSRRTALFVVAAGVLLSYPLWFELNRANIEMFIWALVAGGVWAFYRGRGYTAAACFGVAASMKLYPAVYLALFLARRQFRPLAAGLLVAAAVSVAGLWFVYPNVAVSLHETAAGLRGFNDHFVLHVYPRLIGVDHSLFALYKRLVHPGPARLARAAAVYMPLVAVGGAILFFTRVIRLPFANQVLVLSVATILFPPVSFNYTLLHVYTPLCLLLLSLVGEPLQARRQARRRGMRRGVVLALVLMALCVSPLLEFIHRGVPLDGQLKAVLLLCLFGLGIIVPLPSLSPAASLGNAPPLA